MTAPPAARPGMLPRMRRAPLSLACGSSLVVATFLVASLGCGAKNDPTGTGGASSSSTMAGTAGATGGGGGAPIDPCPKGGTAPITVSIAPIAALTLPHNRTPLTVTASSPQSAVFTYVWSVKSGPAGFRLYHSDHAEATVVGLKEGPYSFAVMSRLPMKNRISSLVFPATVRSE